MYWAKMDDGRDVVVSPRSQHTTRNVGGEEFFIDKNHELVLLDGSWQVVKSQRLRKADYGTPFHHQLQEVK